MTARPPRSRHPDRPIRPLEPLSPSHLPDLFIAGGRDEEVWRWQGGPAPRTEQELAAKAGPILEGAGRGEYVPFAVVDPATGRAVGWTCYMDICVPDERLEIGWTWYGRSCWRTPINTEAKLLLLAHAFGELGTGRVQWKTDVLTTRSRNAILRLGATEEGILRRHRRMPGRHLAGHRLLLDAARGVAGGQGGPGGPAGPVTTR
jgi:N-acetyltransferase